MDPDEWQRYHVANRAPWVDHEPILEEEVERLSPCSALELGCGEGSDVLLLARSGFEVLATEIAPAALEITERRAARAGLSVRTLLSDAVTMRLDETFGFIYMGFLHLPKDELYRALKSAGEHLEPGGTLLYVGFEEVGSPDEVAQQLTPLRIERAEIVGRRMILPESDDMDVNLVIVRAKTETC